MKLFYFLLMMLTLNVSVQAQARPKTKAPAEPRSSQIPTKNIIANPFVNAPFDVKYFDWTKIPKGYLGNDIMKVEPAVSTVTIPQKGEFETTDAYQKRLDGSRQEKVLGELARSSRMAFQLGPLQDDGLNHFSALYDADAGEFLLEIRVADCLELLFGRDLCPSFKVIQMSKTLIRPLGSYIGQNAFGAKIQVRKEEKVSYYLAFDNYDDFQPFFKPKMSSTSDFEYMHSTHNLTFVLPMAANQAEEVKSNLSALLIVHLLEPYSGVSLYRHEAKLDDPRDSVEFKRYLKGHIEQIWLINRLTGDIYKKIGPKELTSATLEIRSPVRNGGLLILDKSMKEIITDSGAEAVEKTGKSAIHDLFATLIMALARQNEPKYKDFIAKVLPSIQKHTVYTAQSELLGAKVKNVRFGDYYVFGVWNDSYNGTCVWDRPLSVKNEHESIDLNFIDATIKFDDGTRRDE